MHDQWRERITSVLSRYPEVVRAVLFGSRAKGTARDGSDIDLALEGEDLDEETVGQIRNALDDLLLPVSVDIVRITSNTKPALKEHIQRVGIQLYPERTRATPTARFD